MTTHFYHAVIDTKDLHLEVDGLELAGEEKEELKELIDSTVLHHLMDVVLEELPEEDSEEFLEKLMVEDHGSVWDHLRDKIDDLEEKLKRAYEQVRQDLLEDLRGRED